jgi:hypothetical protein
VSINPKQLVSDTKPQLQLIPPAAEIAEAKALEYGAFKAVRADGGNGYGPWNWRGTSIQLTTYVGAIRRHLNAIMRGEDIDPRSGLSHWSHIRASTGIVLDAESVGTLIDDRPAHAKPPETRQIDDVHETDFGNMPSDILGWNGQSTHSITQVDQGDAGRFRWCDVCHIAYDTAIERCDCKPASAAASPPHGANGEGQ